MKILALNSGSSSIKYRLFDSENNFLLLEQGVVERIGEKNSTLLRVKGNGICSKENIFLKDHQEAMQALFLNDNKVLIEVDAVGHRVVHGGERFKSPVLIDKKVVDGIKELAKLAPLHCEPNKTGIEVLQRILPNIFQVAVFDTSAHAFMEPKAFLYGLPIEFYEKYKIRKYGFHGINHTYMAQEVARLIKKPLEELKIITCHLGNGSSISAFQKGVSIDNTMGFTPLEGLIMGTRSGDLDPSVVLYLFERFGLKSDQIRDLLNKQSGLLGLCSKSDMRDIILMAESGDKKALVAIDAFVYRVQKYIGAYVAALNGVDAIVFSGGIGENSSLIRALVLKNFSYLGVSVDDHKNEKNEAIFSMPGSSVFLMAIKANEEKVIAMQTYQLLSKKE